MDLSPNMTAVFKAFTDMISRQPLLLYFFICIFLLACFAFLLKLKSSGNFKYRSRGKLFSNAEHSFFLVLKESLSDDYEIFAKVRIADVITPVRGLNRRNWYSAFYKISSKHFGYVLCDKETLSIVAVIELDDSSHNLRKTRTRDIFVDTACETADLKLLRFPCRSNYHIESVRNKIMDSLNSSS